MKAYVSIHGIVFSIDNKNMLRSTREFFRGWLDDAHQNMSEHWQVCFGENNKEPLMIGKIFSNENWFSSDDVHEVHNASANIRYQVDLKNKKLLVRESSVSQSLLLSVNRIIRCVVFWELMARGCVPFHAASVSRGGRSVCVSGNKHSGKTTSMLNLLKTKKFDMQANDKVLLRSDNSEYFCFSLPISVNVRPGTANLFSMKDRADHYYRLNMSTLELCNTFGVRPTFKTFLQGFIYTTYEPGSGELEVYRIESKQERLRQLKSNRLSNIYGDHDFWKFCSGLNQRFVNKFYEDFSKLPSYRVIQRDNTSSIFVDLVESMMGYSDGNV
ncbi:hypothetical protein QWI17_09200 [Gilvimarinus sp. SDUM040013]|uniref:Uncharacterized protein n=1 Tax=Gilvimarinus gilvus TaxID=3058038 RepID=A0ABU4RZZ0_9GAMM|nr:hypothetical protein [Gilvimarinus sp. SDUM040013]MDO3386011.1 hypothetical protein [Gilvimarinus sp. SDUM040013]MDX6850465.1 hypothetical protein [Gilvimarinus sp. SDUM040013]